MAESIILIRLIDILMFLKCQHRILKYKIQVMWMLLKQGWRRSILI